VDEQRIVREDLVSAALAIHACFLRERIPLSIQMKRDLQIPVRLSAVERDLFESRAGDVGLTLGAWMRMVCRESINSEAKENGADSPFSALEKAAEI
jgi:hypothetical protein